MQRILCSAGVIGLLYNIYNFINANYTFATEMEFIIMAGIGLVLFLLTDFQDYMTFPLVVALVMLANYYIMDIYLLDVGCLIAVGIFFLYEKMTSLRA